MGSPISVVLAELTMREIENQVLQIPPSQSFLNLEEINQRHHDLPSYHALLLINEFLDFLNTLTKALNLQ